jgi:hypothetical protein
LTGAGGTPGNLSGGSNDQRPNGVLLPSPHRCDASSDDVFSNFRATLFHGNDPDMRRFRPRE